MRLCQGRRGPRNGKRGVLMWSPPPEHPLRRLFAGLTEQTFLSTLGLADPPLTDYLSELLSRFIHIDAVLPAAQRRRPPPGRSGGDDDRGRGDAAGRPHPPRGASPHRRLHPVLDRRLSRGAEAPAVGDDARTTSSTTANRASAPTTSPARSRTPPTATRPRCCGGSATSSSCAPTA